MKQLFVVLTLAVLCAVPLYAQQLVNGSRYFVPGTSVAMEVSNDIFTGTTIHKLAKLTGAPSTAIITAVSDTSGIQGVVVFGAGTGGTAAIAKVGQAQLVFDGPTTAGDYVQQSTTVVGDGHDVGAVCPGSGQIIGRVLVTNTGAGTNWIMVGADCSGGGTGNIAGITTAAGSGLTGGGTSGTLNLTLLTSCSSNQVLQWNGSAWACATLSTGIGGSGTTTFIPVWTSNSQLGNSNLTVVTSPNGLQYSLGGGLFWQLDASHLSWNSGIAGANNVVIQNTYAPGSNNNAGGIVLEGAPATGSACAGNVIVQGAGTNGAGNGAAITVQGGCSNGFGAAGSDIHITPGSTAAANNGGNVFLEPGTGGAGNGSIKLAGPLLFPTDNIFAIGAVGATRPNNIYAGTSMLAPLFNAATGFQIGGAAASGHYLRGSGTNYIDSTIQAADVPTLNQSTTGNALTATTATNATNASNVPFSGVSAATNNNALRMGTGGSISSTGSGVVDSNSLQGSLLPALVNGNLCYLGSWSFCPAGTGTLTNTGGPLTTNSIVLGVSPNDTKVSTGIVTDGASGLTLGVVAGASGALTFKGLTSGTCPITVAATAGTLNICGNVTVTPAGVVVATGFTGPLTGTASDASGLKGSAVPAPSVGFLNWTGAAYAWSSAGTGSVTNVTKNDTDIAALLTLAITNPTSTPLLTFTRANAAANTIWGNNTGGSAPATFGFTVGTAAGNIVKLDGSAHLPAVDGSALTGITPTQVGLSNVTNDVQTKAAVVPNTAPAAGQLLVGNAGGTAYAPVTLSGDESITSTGVVTNTKLNSGAIPLTKTIVGTNGAGQIVDATAATLANNTTGSAATLTTPRTIAGNSFDGSANVPFPNKFIVQGTTDAGLTGAQFLGALGTGILKNTITTGVLNIAVAGDFPTLNQNTTGTAANLTGCTPSTAGTICIWTGAAWALLAGNTTSTKVLQETSAGVASWVTAGAGTVTSVGTGTGLCGGPVTTSGTLTICNTAVTPGTYPAMTATVNAQGQITAASSSGATTVVGAGNLTNTALVTGGGTQTLQTPSPASTLDSSGNLILAGSITTGGATGAACGTVTSCVELPEVSTAGLVPTAGRDAVAPDSTAHAFKVTLNGGTPFVSLMNYAVAPLAAGGTNVDLSAAGGVVNTTGTFVLKQNASHVINSAALIAADLPTNVVGTASDVLARTTAQAAVTLATAPTAGAYRVLLYADQNANCTTGTATVNFTLSWTDATLARTATVGPFTLASTNSAVRFISSELPIWVGSGNVTYSSTISPLCTTGTASYDVHASLRTP